MLAESSTELIPCELMICRLVAGKDSKPSASAALQLLGCK